MKQRYEGKSLRAFLAPRGFAPVLQEELHRHGVRILACRDRLFLTEDMPEMAAWQPVWAQNIWLNPRFVPVSSIKDAARQLTSVQRNWHLYSTAHHRRAALIAQTLPHVSSRPLNFSSQLPQAPLGSWTLWEENCLLASPACTSLFPDGEVHFNEDRIHPPSRAYLKLWELFTLIPAAIPPAGALCLDLGAAPGGWSWVLASLGARVFAIDKAPLAPEVAAMPNVESCLGSGFGLDPRHAGAVDWLFSDMICYPERLLEVIERWNRLGQCRNFVCTVKCQGSTDYEVLDRFAAIPGSRLLHLSCNKHELTWVCLRGNTKGA